MSVAAGLFAARHTDSHGHCPQKQLDLRKHVRQTCTATIQTPKPGERSGFRAAALQLTYVTLSDFEWDCGTRK